MERFFYRCCAVREAELKEFLFRTYQGAAPLILSLPWREGAEIIKEGRERSQRNDFWMMYCNIYPRMTEETFVEFHEWYESCKRPAAAGKATTEEIVANVNDIILMTLGGNDGGITV